LSSASPSAVDNACFALLRVCEALAACIFAVSTAAVAAFSACRAAANFSLAG
jgi:hypothetical protein